MDDLAVFEHHQWSCSCSTLQYSFKTIMQVLFLNMHHITTNYECDADANKRSLSKGYSYCLKKSILR